MHIPSLPGNVFTSAVSQALTGAASRTSGAKSFDSELESGNIAGAQSFLTALQQKLSPGSSGGSGSAISAQITQVSNDLKSGDLTAAQTDFSRLKLGIAQQKHATAVPISSNGSQLQSDLAQSLATGGNATDPSLAALASYSALQQGAFAGAVNLSLPNAASTFSINT